MKSSQTNPDVFFLDRDMKWRRHYDPLHGSATSILPHVMAVPEVKKVPNAPDPRGTERFSESFAEHRPIPTTLFYGRFPDMVLVRMFGPRCDAIPYTPASRGEIRPDRPTRNPRLGKQLCLKTRFAGRVGRREVRRVRSGH